MTRRLRIEWRPGDKVTARLAMPAGGGATGMLLAHGAGAGQDHPFMAGVRDGLAAAGYPVLTFNYPYMEAGRSRPDRPAMLLDAHRAALARLRGYCERVVLAGKSMGGRIGSHVAAEGEEAVGLAFYGYPIVAPGKKEPRDLSHLEAITAPMLFLTGSRDPLCPLDLLVPLVGRLPAAEAAIIEDGDHSFRVPKRTGLTYPEVIEALVAMTADWLGGLSA